MAVAQFGAFTVGRTAIGWPQMDEPQLPFEFWRACLRVDCVREDKLFAFEALGDECLQLLWESGTPPSVQGSIQAERAVAITVTADPLAAIF